MNIVVISGNPKTDGLCQSVIRAACTGAKDGGADVEEVRLAEHEIARCHVCGTGWGPCREEHICTYGDDGYDTVADKIQAADAVILATPVYWGEMAENIKSFLDRFRRCNFGSSGALSGKQVLLLATPGGSGRGLLSCLDQMNRFCQHTGAVVFDHISANRWSADYKRDAAYAAGKAMASGRKNGDTVG